MSNTLQEIMRKATRLTAAGRLRDATDLIRRTLGGVNGADSRPPHSQTRAEAAYDANTARTRIAELSAPAKPPRLHENPVLDVEVVTDTVHSAAPAQAPSAAPASAPLPEQQPETASAQPVPQQATIKIMAGDNRSEFRSGTFTHATLTRGYKLFVPPSHGGRQLPLVVMLHGCTQNPDDFAAGTGMNEAAREQDFFVLYPEQAQSANPSRCWNWFNHNHQQRDRGEPALLAEMTQAVIKQHDIDPARVYIAGLSAGAAMAVIVAAAYPEMFAAVGVHSGLARGAASNVLEALKVMKNGIAGPSLPINGNRVGFTSAAAAARTQITVPTIVFHGDKDQTVHARNGEQVIEAALSGVSGGAAGSAAGDSNGIRAGSRQVQQGVSAQGRRYTRATHHDAQGNAVAEHWVLHGAGHAWSGGHAAGTYTDAKGPDATREMLRFFFAQRREATSTP